MGRNQDVTAANRAALDKSVRKMRRFKYQLINASFALGPTKLHVIVTGMSTRGKARVEKTS